MEKRPHSPHDSEETTNDDPHEVVRLPVGEEEKQREPVPVPAVRSEPMRPSMPVSVIDEQLEPKETVVRREEETSWDSATDSRTQTPMGWIALVGLILIGLCVWAVVKLRSGSEQQEQRLEEVRQLQDEDEREQREAEQLLAKVEKSVAHYLAAEDVEQKSAFVRHRERVLPLMKRYYEANAYAPSKLVSVMHLVPVTIENRPFLYLNATDEAGVKRSFVVEQTEDDRFLFDWEAEVAYQPMPFDDYVRGRGTEGMEFRVYAKLDNFYAYEFADSERFRSLYIKAPNSEEYLFGYTERGSRADREVMEQLEGAGGQIRPFLLRLRFLADSPAERSVLVEEVVAPRWTYSRNPTEK